MDLLSLATRYRDCTLKSWHFDIIPRSAQDLLLGFGLRFTGASNTKARISNLICSE